MTKPEPSAIVFSRGFRDGFSKKRRKNWSNGVPPGTEGTRPPSPCVSASCPAACSVSSTEILTTAGSTCSARGAKLGNAIETSFCACCVRLPGLSAFSAGDCAPENAGNRTRAAHPAPANVNRTRLQVIGSHLLQGDREPPRYAGDRG